MAPPPRVFTAPHPSYIYRPHPLYIYRPHCLRPPSLRRPSAMQQATVLAALLAVVIICSVHSSPYAGDRDFDVPFRKKPLRRGSFQGERLLLVEPFDSSPIETASAFKRGCSAFGHSCFGGHGKRSDSSSLMEPQLQQAEQRLHQRLPNTDLFKQWLQAYRGSPSLLDGQ
uniref:Uncharacterized protein n=1 Tax=Lygus hesperus TaxID=30085 RepID=A0A146LVY8_LYGHE